MQIKRTHENRDAKYIGRGGRRGKTSGRGTKGQKARAGNKIRPALRDAIKKLPRLRGVTINKRGSLFTSVRLAPVAISLSLIDKKFEAGGIVTPAALLEKKLIPRIHGRTPRVKILGGKISKKISFSGCAVTKGARAAIEASGGTIS
ncbi:MAG: uL15 family ribosomal protein [Patescibacteria group bacterium]